VKEKSFQENIDNSVCVQHLQILVSLACADKNYWLAGNVGHGDGGANLKRKITNRNLQNHK
jgi:hypothetical protein